MPLWNPYGCGGEVLWANPQALPASPYMPFVLVFGTALGIKLALVAYAFCTFDGAYRLTRSYDVSVGGSLLSAVVFGTSGWFALHISSGHATFTGAALFPYLWLFYRWAVAPEPQAWRWSLPLGLIAAIIVADGGTFTPAMAAVMLFAVATIDAVTRRSVRPYLPLLLGGVVAVAIGAARILPALEFATDHPRPQSETDGNTIWSMLFDGYLWKGIAPVDGKRYWFHEYGWRLPYITPVLIIASLWARRTRSVWIVVAVGFALAAGRDLPYGPWWVLKHLPIYRDLRVPSRYSLLLALGFSILCGGAWDELAARRRWIAAHLRSATIALIAICAVDGLAFDWYIWKDVFNTTMFSAPRATRFYQAEHTEWRTMMNTNLENHGAIGCDEEAPLQRADKLDEGDVPQARLADPGAGFAREVNWTPNRITVHVRLTQPTTLLINQDWNEHWKTSVGTIQKVGGKVARDVDGGRLGVALPVGENDVTITYRPRSFVIGAAISCISTPLLLLAWLLLSRRKKRAGAG